VFILSYKLCIFAPLILNGLKVKESVFFVAFLLLLSGSRGYSQVPVSEVGLPANQKHVTALYHHGIVIPHHAYMVYFIDDFSRGFELNYGVWRFDQEGWQRYYNYPEVGVGFSYNSYGNADIYGQGMAIYPYIHIPIVRTARFTVKNKVALGLGYTNNPFDYEKNPRNQIFGARMNAYVGLGIYSGYRVFDNWSVYAAASLNHMSNGAIRKPNNGINTFTLGVGTRYHFLKNHLPNLKSKDASRTNKRDIQVFLNYGRSQSRDFNFNIYSSGSFSINHIWYRSVKSAWSAGLDVVYYGAAPFVYIEPHKYSHVPHFERLFYGVWGGRHWLMGETSLFVQVGAYLYSEIEPPQPVYPRVGIRHNITDWLVANFSVKASFFRAEFLEFGLGYRIPYKKNSL